MKFKNFILEEIINNQLNETQHCCQGSEAYVNNFIKRYIEWSWLRSSVKLTKLGSLLSESYVKACRAAPELTSNDWCSERSIAAASRAERNVSA